MIGNYFVPQEVQFVLATDLKPHEKYEEYHESLNVVLDDHFIKSIRKMGHIELPLLNPEGLVLSGWRRIQGWIEAFKDDETKMLIPVYRLNPDKEHAEILKNLEEEIIIMANSFKEKTQYQLAKSVKYLFQVYGDRVGRPAENGDAVMDTENGFLRIIVKPEQHNEIKGKTSEIVHKITKINEKWLLFLKDLPLDDSENIELLKSIDEGRATKKAAQSLYRKKTSQGNSKKPPERNPSFSEDNQNINYDDYFKLYCQSSVDLSIIPNESVDCVVCSPPYGNERQYSNNIEEDLGYMNLDSPNLTYHKYELIFRELKRVCKRTGNFYLNIGDFHHKDKLFEYPETIKNIAKKVGFKLVNTIIYRKTNPQVTSGEKINPPSWEYIYHLVKSQDYVFNPYKIPTKDGKLKIERTPIRHNQPVTNFESHRVQEGEKVINNFWEDQTSLDGSVANLNLFRKYGVNTNITHAAPFPPMIPFICVYQGSNIGETILDPFNGSGMTGKFAIEMGRKYIGVDLNEAYINASNQVLQKVVDELDEYIRDDFDMDE